LFDYSLVPQWVEFLRKYPIAWPFITFQYKAVPALAEVLMTNPQRYLPYVALYFAWKMAAMAALDIDDEEELERARFSLAEWVRDNPGLLPMPFMDDEGRMQFFDISYIFPWSMPLSMLKHAKQGEYAEAVLGDTGIGSGVVPDVLAGLKTNTHPFYGKEIWLENDPGNVKMAKGIEYVWNVYAPGFMTTESSNPPVKMYEAIRGRSSVYKTPPTKGEAWARLFGINLYTVNSNDAGKNLYFMYLEIQEYQRQKQAQMMQEPWRKEEIKDEMVDRIIDLRRDMVDYQLEIGMIDEEQARAAIKKLNEKERE
jgi:hypothetical protein